MSTGPYCHYYCLRCQHFSDSFSFFPYLVLNIQKLINRYVPSEKKINRVLPTPHFCLHLSEAGICPPASRCRCQVCRRGGEGGHIRQHFAELSKQQKMPPLCPRPVTYTPTHPHHIRIKSWLIPYLKSAPGLPPQLLH